MHTSVRRLALALLAVPAAAHAQSANQGFDVQRLADGVYATIRREPFSLLFQSNGGFIVGDEGVLVIDAQFSAAATRDVLAAIRRVTDKPVRYVVNTHWHDDHITGNRVYQDAFPNVEFIGHVSAPADMAGMGATNRKGLIDALPQALPQFRDVLKGGKRSDGTALSDEDRTAIASDIALGEQYLAEVPMLRIIPPTVAVTDHMALHWGTRTIDIRFLGRGHTPGDLVVHLPAEGIVFAGDLVTWPVPLVGSTSLPGDFAATLGALRALGATVIVPGHGPLMRDDKYVQLVQRMLISVRDQTAAAVARGETLEQARKSVNLSTFRSEIAGGSRLRDRVFSTYVEGPAIARAYEDAKAKGKS
jgi:cyclase